MVATWVKYLSSSNLRTMSPSDPIAPETVLPLAEAFEELQERYIQRGSEIRDLEAVAHNEREACVCFVRSLVGLGGRFKPDLMEEIATLIEQRDEHV